MATPEMNKMEKTDSSHVDIKKHLNDHFKAELADADGYFTMAENAEKMGKEEMARGLYMMAKDELTHADFIAEQMKAHGTMADEESWEKFEQLKIKFKPLFC